MEGQRNNRNSRGRLMPRRQAERHLLDLVRALAALHDGRRMQWASHADLAARLPELDTPQLDALITVAIAGMDSGQWQPSAQPVSHSRGTASDPQDLKGASCGPSCSSTSPMSRMSIIWPQVWH